ncbi:serine/threonine-protein kinase CTR1-like [Gastrolobium bilobum]|uniref:serine/threonine-protein kinase CTR1-like n=1 Tax=Gastrolobium bilobum TaxID=150636 RepID=UPI002AAF6B73|nr:serine/threonine-protein kinase CTR1-like [Gastrolobium bilobum]
MPHRTTYFFPRQFPERGLDESSKQLLDHEKNKIVNSFKSNTFGVESDPPKKPLSSSTTPADPTKDDVVVSSGKNSLESDLFAAGDKFRTKHNQIAAFCDWLVDKKGHQSSHHLKPYSRHHRRLFNSEEDRDLNVKETSVDRSFDRQVSLQRLSSGSSYAGSLFSGTTLDGNFSSDIKEETSSSGVSTTTARRQHEEENKEQLANKCKESYILQLTLAKKLTCLANLVTEPVLTGTTETWDDESVSYRLWVSGCLSYSDKISDGFYNILGMNPYLWGMCNDVEEGRRIPTLIALKAVEPSETSMEVVLVDRHVDSRLKLLQDKAQELYSASENTLVLVEQLGKLVAIYMGGTFPEEQGDLHKRWNMVSKRLRNFHNCVVLPIGSLSTGLCRHRAILFKRLADYIGLPCRIARGCKYCAADHRSSCLVQIKDDKQLPREYVVDLVGEPGNIHGPDSSINGAYISSMPSPFQISHLKESQSPYMDGATNSPSIRFNRSSVIPGSHPHSDYGHKDQQVKETDLLKNHKGSIYASVDQTCEGTELPVIPFGLKGNNEECAVLGSILPTIHEDVSKAHHPTTKASLHEYPRLVEDAVVVQETSNNDIIVTGCSVVKCTFKQSVLSSSCQSDPKQVDKRIENQNCLPAGNIPKFLNLEPSLAMDWLEISWDDLRIKERVGAGSFGTVHCAEWHGSDVAVKVLTDQDFHDDQLKEFLREVAIMKRVRHPNVVLFMGAVTKRPHLSIVTEYLPRGSLYRLIHRPAPGEILDHRRRLRMALDVAKGINYLHCLKPPIVHWDLKSPNLLVDKNWTVKVCDFGLSRFKANTFISSKSVAGTPEWMAPEFLRGEPSNEKSDVYSFGVILWELVTMQQPWSGLSPAQVVGAVAFQNRRLVIPANISPVLVSLMESCWADDPDQRPSFASIVESLKKLLKSPAEKIKMSDT